MPQLSIFLSLFNNKSHFMSSCFYNREVVLRNGYKRASYYILRTKEAFVHINLNIDLSLHRPYLKDEAKIKLSIKL